MSETPLSPRQEERKILERFRDEVIEFHEQIMGEAAETFEAIQSFEDFMKDESAIPRFATDEKDGKTYYYLDSKWVLAGEQSQDLEGVSSPVDRHNAVRISLGYQKEKNPMISRPLTYGHSSTFMSILSGSEAKSFKQALKEEGCLPDPQKVQVAVRVAGTGDAQVDESLGKVTWVSQTVSGLSIPLHDWGFDITYPENPDGLEGLARRQGRFLTELMLDVHEERILAMRQMFDGIVAAARDTDLNPRS